MKKLSILLLIAMTGMQLSAQVETEAGFMYIKAKYLHETDRHDDAIREFNKVIKIDAAHEDALVLRASSKYALAAYTGAELDILEYIKLKGITPDAAKVLGMSQYALYNYLAATASLRAAAQLAPSDPDPLELLGKMAEKDDELEAACKYYNKAAQLGSTKAANRAGKICGEYADIDREGPKLPNTEDDKISIGTRLDPVVEEDDEEDPGDVVADPDLNTDLPDETAPINDLNKAATDKLKQTTAQKEPVIRTENEDKVATSPISTRGEDPVNEVVKEVVEEVEEEVDDTVNEVVIDDDLTIKITGQGLGSRPLKDQPNILILSESDGTVVIDVCVNKAGAVTSADFNMDESTLDKKSLISLAIRKSKDFVFVRGSSKEQCGLIIFDIKGS